MTQMIKKSIALVISICISTNICVCSFANTDDVIRSGKETNSIGELGGYLSANVKISKQFYTERRFTELYHGHCFAAERGNNLIDALKGNRTSVVGDNNLINGPDRMIINRNGSITWIQDKYYSSASLSLNAAFDETTGLYRYIDGDGKPMKLEVPSDQYDDVVLKMRDKIKNGLVPNVSDPDEAVNVVKKGGLSYQQAKNLAKAGTIDSLKYDATNGVITSACAAGIGFAIDYACCVLNGIDSKTAIKNAGMNGLKTGGVVFATYVISSQLAKTGLPNALAPTAEAIAKSLGKDVCEAILVRNGVSTAGKDVVKHAAQIISKELIVDGVLIVVLTGVDVVELFRGRISKEELLKNLSVSIIGVAVGTAGVYGGAALGSLIAPGAGTAIGGILLSLLAGTLSTVAAEALISPFYESDAEEMFAIISDEFLTLCNDYLINESEASKVTNKLKSTLAGDTLKDMYASEDRKKFAKDLLEPLFEEQARDRKSIALPSEEDMRLEMKNALQGVVFVH